VSDVEPRALTSAPAGVIYAGGNGVYRSNDSGRTWTRLPGNFKVEQVLVAPSDPKVLYASMGEGCFSGSDGELYRSGDGGATWTQVTGGPFELDINPSNPNHLDGLKCDGLYRSIDGGKTWTKLPGVELSNYTPSILARGVNNRSYMYVVHASEGGSIAVQRTSDDGRTWQTLQTPEFYGPADFVVDPLDARHVYLVAGSGFYASSNAGDRWNRLSKGLEPTNADLGSYLQLSDLVLDRFSPPPRGATATLYVGSYGDDKVKPAGIFRWNGNDAWVPFAPAPNGEGIRQLLVVNDANVPTLIAATDTGLYRWPLK
jgi:photosystem II stability/assembly factor-like uncharacterized protein